MVHIYRSRAVRKSGAARFFGSGFFILLVVTALLFGVFSNLHHVETQFDWFTTLLGVVFVGFLVEWHNRHDCRGIRLSDDGMCEFETKRRVIRLHVNKIRSVKYSPDDDESSESYTIHYQGGKLGVASAMTDFPDFLSRLKALNPAVDLTSFPADTSPDFGTPATEKPAPLSRFFRNALFPLIVVSLLVYLTSQTFLGK